jgi:hypothetical protein
MGRLNGHDFGSGRLSLSGGTEATMSADVPLFTEKLLLGNGAETD